MNARRVVVVGDTLLDRDVVGQVDRLCPDAPVPVFDQQDEYLRPGGAGLAAVLAASGGRPVTLVTALADDDAGRRLRRLLADAGVDVVDLSLRGPTPEKVRVWAAGRSLLRVDRGGPPTDASVGPCRATVPGHGARRGRRRGDGGGAGRRLRTGGGGGAGRSAGTDRRSGGAASRVGPPSPGPGAGRRRVPGDAQPGRGGPLLPR